MVPAVRHNFYFEGKQEFPHTKRTGACIKSALLQGGLLVQHCTPLYNMADAEHFFQATGYQSVNC